MRLLPRGAKRGCGFVAPGRAGVPVPSGQGGIGQANIWYADDPKQHRQFRTDLLRYIETRRSPPPVAPGRAAPDPLHRQRVEEAAVRATWEYYSALGYSLDSVEADHVGWDLNALGAGRHLRLEVKGLSGSRVRVELTPNEYEAMQSCRDSYRVCVVTEALTSPRLSVFAFSAETGRWADANGRPLEIEPMTAARCSAE